MLPRKESKWLVRALRRRKKWWREKERMHRQGRGKVQKTNHCNGEKKNNGIGVTEMTENRLLKKTKGKNTIP